MVLSLSPSLSFSLSLSLAAQPCCLPSQRRRYVSVSLRFGNEIEKVFHEEPRGYTHVRALERSSQRLSETRLRRALYQKPTREFVNTLLTVGLALRAAALAEEQRDAEANGLQRKLAIDPVRDQRQAELGHACPRRQMETWVFSCDTKRGWSFEVCPHTVSAIRPRSRESVGKLWSRSRPAFLQTLSIIHSRAASRARVSTATFCK